MRVSGFWLILVFGNQVNIGVWLKGVWCLHGCLMYIWMVWFER